MIQIDRNVPIPVHVNVRGKLHNAYPLAQMEVGDSIFVPCGSKSAYNISRSVQQSIRHAKKTGRLAEGVTFVFDKRTENGMEGVRIWRAA
jgi:hypothetical protein